MSSTMPDTRFSDFFHHLGERRYRENDLSDITWALCRSMQGFDSMFAHFLIPSVPLDACVEVEREVDLGEGCRIDFVCRTESVTGYVEVKIYDRNYHLEQYARQMHREDNFQLVLLTNHGIDLQHRKEAEKWGWQIREWRDFAQQVEKTFPANELVTGYLQYLRGVCNMIDWRDIRFDTDSLYSLVPLHVLLEETIEAATHDEFAYSRYRSARDHGRSWTGACFQLDYRNGDIHRKSWGFFGLDFKEPGATALIAWFDRDWNSELLKGLSPGDTQRSSHAWSKREGFGIKVPDDQLQHFLRLPLDKQRSNLLLLFRAVVKPIEERLAF